MTYSLAHFGAMLQDEFRTRAYVDALKRLIKPDSVVLDIGAGSGYFSLLAAELGARKIYAIEPSVCVNVLNDCLKHSNLQDKIKVFQDVSQNVELPGQVDVIISDLRGGTPFLSEHIPTLQDARQRFLRPSGVLLPQKDTLYAAPVCLAQYKKLTRPASTTLHPLDMTPKHHKLLNQLHPLLVRPEELVMLGKPWAEIIYADVESPNASGSCGWEVDKACEINGFAWWFDCKLFEDVGFSAQPGNQTAYRNWFFPLPEQLKLKPGDKVDAKFSALYTQDDYKFSWNTKIYSKDGSEPSKSFNQSTFKGEIIDPKMLKTAMPGIKPKTNREGQAALFALQQMSGENSIEQVAQSLEKNFADVFKNKNSARALVQKLSMKYADL